MAINQAMCGSYKREAIAGIHFWLSHSRTGSSSIGADTFKIAMFTSSRSDANEDLTGYTTSNEVSGTGYTAGGEALSSVTCGLSDNSSSVPEAFLDFADTTWSSSTITARGALIYNSSTTAGSANRAVAVLDFGSDKTTSAGDFTITFPTADASSAINRIDYCLV